VVGNTTMVPMTVNRRFVELGPRLNDFSPHPAVHLGLKAIFLDWTYDVSWTRGNADQTQVRGNWGSMSKVQQALNALSTTSCVNPPTVAYR
jgi:hypothetical protein